jgi:hypothetical protein
VDIGLDLVNIFFKQNDQEIRGILAKVGWFVYGYCCYGAFAAVKADGAITAWGYPYAGGIGAPPSSGYTKIYSTDSQGV